MGRPPYGARTTCESCNSIDVRQWHRQGRLTAGQHFTCSWTYFGGESAGNINVRTEPDAVVLAYQSRSGKAAEWKAINQRDRSHGPTVISGAGVPGLSALPIAKANTVGDGFPSFMEMGTISHAAAAVIWRMQASKNPSVCADL
jgi:hypothetical protein